MADPIKTHATGEPSRRHTNTGGRFPNYSGHKMRGNGELFSEVMDATRKVREMGRTQSPVAPVPRHVVVADDVVRGLGLDAVSEQKILKALDNALLKEPGRSTQSYRFAKARSMLSGIMRSLEVDSDRRAEVMKRAVSYWKRTYRTDTGRTPQVRARTFKSQRFVICDPMRKASKGEQASQHKYESRKPDGHGGWLYKYPGDKDYGPGRGAHEGHTAAPEGKGRAAHDPDHQHTTEEHPDGGLVHHFHAEVSAHASPNMSVSDHHAEAEKHKAAHKEAKAAGDDEKAAAHVHAHNTHVRAARALAAQAEGRRTRGEGPGSELGPGKGGKKPAGGRQGAAGAKTGPGARSGAASPPSGAGRGAGAPSGEGSEEVGQESKPLFDSGVPDRQSHVPMSQEVSQMRESLGKVTNVMKDVLAASTHVSDIESKMKGVKASKMPRRHKKMMLAQLKAEHAAAKLDQVHLENAHDQAMKELKTLTQNAKSEALRNHPIVKGLLALLDKLGLRGPKDGEEGKTAEQTAPKESAVAEGGVTGEAGTPAKNAAAGNADAPEGAHPKVAAQTKDSDGDNIPDGLDKNPKKAGGKGDVKGGEPKGESAKKEAKPATAKEAKAAHKAAKKEADRLDKIADKLERKKHTSKEAYAAWAAADEAAMDARGKSIDLGSHHKALAKKERARKSYGTPDFMKAIAMAEGARDDLRKHKPSHYVFTAPQTRRVRLEW